MRGHPKVAIAEATRRASCCAGSLEMTQSLHGGGKGGLRARRLGSQDPSVGGDQYLRVRHAAASQSSVLSHILMYEGDRITLGSHIKNHLACRTMGLAASRGSMSFSPQHRPKVTAAQFRQVVAIIEGLLQLSFGNSLGRGWPSNGV